MKTDRSCQRGVQKCERKNPEDTRGGSALGTRTDSPAANGEDHGAADSLSPALKCSISQKYQMLIQKQ